MPRWTRRARRDFEGSPEPLKSKILAAIDKLDSDPSSGSKLQGKLSGLRSVRVGRSYRVVYSLESDGPLVRTMGPRRDVYR
jgi:mRNA-degrading endonuclease RelE of RelBE toxin-antitoxin system